MTEQLTGQNCEEEAQKLQELATDALQRASSGTYENSKAVYGEAILILQFIEGYREGFRKAGVPISSIKTQKDEIEGENISMAAYFPQSGLISLASILQLYNFLDRSSKNDISSLVDRLLRHEIRHKSAHEQAKKIKQEDLVWDILGGEVDRDIDESMAEKSTGDGSTGYESRTKRIANKMGISLDKLITLYEEGKQGDIILIAIISKLAYQMGVPHTPLITLILNERYDTAILALLGTHFAKQIGFQKEKILKLLLAQYITHEMIFDILKERNGKTCKPSQMKIFQAIFFGTPKQLMYKTQISQILRILLPIFPALVINELLRN